MNSKAIELIKQLGLQELPEEGGYFARTYQAKETLQTPRGQRHIGDAIYYLITKDQFSGLHLLQCDEMWHFYAGDPVEMLLFDDKTFNLIELGNSDFTRHHPQQLVGAGQWQGAKLKDGGEWALIGTNAFPAYAQEDFSLGKLDTFKDRPLEQLELIKRYAK